LLVSGTASSEGAMTRSADGRLLVIAGYNIALTNATLLGSSLANASAASAPRALGVLDTCGNFAIAAVTTNQYGGDNMRSGTTDGSGNYWGAGATSGTFYFGGAPPNTIQTNIVNSIVIQDLGGNLYFSTQKDRPGLWKIPGTPTVFAANTAMFLSAGSKANPYAFALSSNASTAYLADDTLKGAGGIQRWDFSGGAWAMTYAFTSLTNVGARGVAVDFSRADPVIYVTTAESSANRLVVITDTGADSSATTLATAGVNQIFRGVALAPNAAVDPHIFNSVANSNGFVITWTSLLDQNYTVQWASDLSTANWTTLTNLTSALPTTTVIDATAPANANRFYRIIMNP
jgi:hypothetical protein